MRRYLVFCIAFAVALVLTAGNALAFYTWVDDSGHLHVTDYPKPSKAGQEAVPDQGQEKKAAEPVKTETQTKPVEPAAAQQVSASASSPAPKSEQKPAPLQPTSPIRPSTASSPTIAPVTQTTATAVQPKPVVPQTMPAQQSLPGEMNAAPAMVALLMGFYSVFLVILVLAYIYVSLCIFLIARKLNVAGAWMAWIPIIQVFPFIASASKPAWWVLLLLVPIVNMFVSIYLWMCITENLGREKWFALLMLVPVVNIIYMGVLAFSKPGSGASLAVA